MNKFTLNKVLSELSSRLIDEKNTYLIDVYHVEVFHDGNTWNERGICVDREWSIELQSIHPSSKALVIKSFNTLSAAMKELGVDLDVLNPGRFDVIELL